MLIFYIFLLYLIFVLFFLLQNDVKSLYWTIIMYVEYNTCMSCTLSPLFQIGLHTHIMSECLKSTPCRFKIVMNILCKKSVSVNCKLTVLEFITSWGFPFRLPMDVIVTAVKTVSGFHISDKCDCCDGNFNMI